MRRFVVLPLCGLVVTLAGWAAVPAPAHAGSYKMYTCNPPGVNLANPTRGPWAYDSTTPNNQLDDACARGGAMSIGHLNTVTMPAGTTTSFDLTPAPPIGIAQVVNYVSTALTTTAATSPPSTAGGIGVDPAIAGPPGGNASQRPYTSVNADPPAPTAKIGVVCNRDGAGCSFASTPQMLVHGIVTTLVENVPPTGVISGGGILAPGARSGAPLLSYASSDAHSGVETVEALLGDTVVGTDSQARDLTVPIAQQVGQCAYTGLAACPTQVTRDIAVDTTRVPNGTYPLSLRVTDAAQNRTVVAGPAIAVLNPTAPGTPNGAGATRGAKLRLSYTTTKKRSRRMGFRSRPTVEGSLVNEVGQPIAGASIALTTRRRQFRAPLVTVATVRTGADGAFRFKLPAGPSRTIGASYTAFSGDPRPAASASLRMLVRARLTAKAARRARVGRSLRITGRLIYLPRRGVEINIQALDGKVWRPIGSTRTRAKGRYTFRYRFKRTARGRRFALRARVSSPIYPFTAGVSKRLRVRIR